jgi:sugar (pentulose or hexulose) kinase
MATPGHTLSLGIDVGTTGTKAIVVDAAGVIHGRGRAGYRLSSPCPGQYVQDAHDWERGVAGAVRAACDGIEPGLIGALAISAQGGTLVAVDGSHRPLGPARSWLDRRAKESAAEFERVFGAADFYRRTGWPIAPNNTAAQLLDLASSEPDTFVNARYFCDTAAYLNGWLVGTPTIDTNVAGIAQLVDARSATWDRDILEVIGVGPDRLPRIAIPGTPIGSLTEPAATALGLRAGTVVGAGAHDQYCAALGADALEEGDILLSTGTAWVALAVASKPFADPTVGIGSGRHLVPGLWGHFGEVSNGGVSIEWARRLLNHGDHEPVSLDALDPILRSSARGSGGVSFFPFFDGTSPYDALEASRGSLLGLSLSHDHRQVLRAVAEGVAFSLRILLNNYYASADDSRRSLPVVVGGATRSREWMQLVADILGSDLLVGAEPDAACVGAAILAATAAGVVADPRAGVEQMACLRTVAAADAAATRAYEPLFARYDAEAKSLGGLYAARSQSPPRERQP